jgi:hypothetical protein
VTYRPPTSTVLRARDAAMLPATTAILPSLDAAEKQAVFADLRKPARWS